MIGWAIYPTPEEGTVNAFGWMQDSAKNNGIELVIRFAEQFSVLISDGSTKIYYDGEECALPYFVLMRHYDYRLSCALESCGVTLFNSSNSMRLSQDKFLTHTLLTTKGIATPDTLWGERSYGRCVERFGTPFVFKAIRGSKGMEVFLINNKEEFLAVRDHYEYIVQQYISTSYGRDIRVWVIGGRAVASVLRRSNISFKSNIALGACAERFVITPEIEALAVASCNALGLELGGVDILFDGDGYCVCEVNGNAGFRAFSQAGEAVDIPNLIFSYIAKQSILKK